MMAKLGFKKNGTPFVDFRVQGTRYRPEFLSIKDAQKFEKLANANPVHAYELWQDSLSSVEVPAPALSLREKVESFKADYCSKRTRSNDMKFHIQSMFDFLIERASTRAKTKLDDLSLIDVKLEDLSAFQTHLVNKGLVNASVNRYFTTVKTFFKRMYLAQYVPVNYSGLIENLKVQLVKREAWTEDDSKALIAELKKKEWDQVLIDVVHSMEFSPFGPLDFARLRWDMIDFNTGKIRTIRMKGKGQRDWIVPMLLGYQKLLLDIRKRQEAIGLGRAQDFVYLDKECQPLKAGWVSKSLERARKDAQIVHVPYSSRHRIISAVAEKTDVRTASKFAGHASIKTTETHYIVGGDDGFVNKVKEAFEE
jgi:site-specific recombinase XerD